MTFKVGQQVVCIADYAESAKHWRVHCPVKDQIYTVRNLEFRSHTPSLRLREIVNKERNHWTAIGLVYCEPSFASECFRPLMERSTETGMAILRSLLTPERVRDLCGND